MEGIMAVTFLVMVFARSPDWGVMVFFQV